MTKREKERKIKMIGMIGMSVLIISSLATSTYAWFVSRNKATVNTTTMTVDAGLQYKFFAFNGNFQGSNPSNPVAGYTTATPTGTFENNFTEITSASQTAFDNMWPGERLTFAVHVWAISKTKITLSVTEFASEITGINIRAVKIVDEVVQMSAIDMAWAINLYGCQSADAGYYSQFIEGYEPYDSTVQSPTKTALTNVLPRTIGTVVSDETKETEFTLAESTSTDGQIDQDATYGYETYLFYTVEFSNLGETWYRETDSTGTAEYPYHGTGDIKYYIQDSIYGNSSCYEGLSFSISQLKIVEGDEA